MLGCECAGVVHMLLSWVCVVVNEVMAGCTVSTLYKYMVLLEAAVDRWERPICVAGRTIKNISKEFQ